MRSEVRMHYSLGFGDGTPGGVRAGKPTKKNWPRKVTPRHPSQIMKSIQQDYLNRDDVCIVHEEIGRREHPGGHLQAKSRGVLEGIHNTGGYRLGDAVTSFL